MGLYFTRTEHKNGFVNLRPIFEFIDDGLIDVDKDERFEPRGLIQINGTQNIEHKLLNAQTYALFTLSETLFCRLQQKDDGTKTIRATDFVNNAKNINSDYRVREVIDIPKELNFEKISEWNSLTDILEPITRYIYLSNSKFVAGPFFWNKDDFGYKFAPAITTGNFAYMVNIYKFEDLKVEPNIYDFDASKNFDDINIYGRIKHLLYGIEQTLPKPVKQIDCISDKELKTIVGRVLSQDLETKKQKQEIKKLINDLPESEITNPRKERITELLKSSVELDDFIKSIPTIVLENAESTEKIAEIIFENENYKNDERLTTYIKKISGYDTKLKYLQEETEKLENYLDDKRAEIEELNYKGKRAISEKEKNALKNQIDSLLKENKELKYYKSNSNSIKELQDQEKTLKNKVDVRRDDIKGIDSEVKNKIQNAYRDLFSHTFDGELANIIINEASKYSIKDEKDVFAKKIKSNKAQLTLSTEKDLNNLIDFIHEELASKANREIDRNDIVNIFLCLSQSFITILAGEPGTGKTSLINLIAKILGLNNDKYNRFLQISVEKGWTSKRDLIGYYNPLSKIFEATDKRLLTALQILDYETENNCSDLPFLILLDEANLSQMEYYWADFMTLCDLDNPNRFISLSQEVNVKIPFTLKFMATINLDNTTESLSPRLIDRAWIITLKSYDIDIDDFDVEFDKISNFMYPIISIDIFKPFYNSEEWKDKRLNDGVIDKFKNIIKLFKDINIKFSPRIIGMIKRYCLAGQSYFDSKNVYVALDYAVAQKILPKINGYGKDYRDFIEKLLKECDDNSMPICNDIINNILQKGRLNMEYYQFFVR